MVIIVYFGCKIKEKFNICRWKESHNAVLYPSWNLILSLQNCECSNKLRGEWWDYLRRYYVVSILENCFFTHLPMLCRSFQKEEFLNGNLIEAPLSINDLKVRKKILQNTITSWNANDHFIARIDYYLCILSFCVLSTRVVCIIVPFIPCRRSDFGWLQWLLIVASMGICFLLLLVPHGIHQIDSNRAIVETGFVPVQYDDELVPYEQGIGFWL
mgnify:CR=1 FL=1